MATTRPTTGTWIGGLGTDETLAGALRRTAHDAGLRVVPTASSIMSGRGLLAFRDVQANGESFGLSGLVRGLRFDGPQPYGRSLAYDGWHGYFDW